MSRKGQKQGESKHNTQDANKKWMPSQKAPKSEHLYVQPPSLKQYEPLNLMRSTTPSNISAVSTTSKEMSRSPSCKTNKTVPKGRGATPVRRRTEVRTCGTPSPILQKKTMKGSPSGKHLAKPERGVLVTEPMVQMPVENSDYQSPRFVMKSSSNAAERLRYQERGLGDIAKTYRTTKKMALLKFEVGHPPIYSLEKTMERGDFTRDSTIYALAGMFSLCSHLPSIKIGGKGSGRGFKANGSEGIGLTIEEEDFENIEKELKRVAETVAGDDFTEKNIRFLDECVRLYAETAKEVSNVSEKLLVDEGLMIEYLKCVLEFYVTLKVPAQPVVQAQAVKASPSPPQAKKSPAASPSKKSGRTSPTKPEAIENTHSMTFGTQEDELDECPKSQMASRGLNTSIGSASPAKAKPMLKDSEAEGSQEVSLAPVGRKGSVTPTRYEKYANWSRYKEIQAKRREQRTKHDAEACNRTTLSNVNRANVEAKAEKKLKQNERETHEKMKNILEDALRHYTQTSAAAVAAAPNAAKKPSPKKTNASPSKEDPSEQRRNTLGITERTQNRYFDEFDRYFQDRVCAVNQMARSPQKN